MLMDPTGKFAITLTTLLIGAGIGAVIGASIGVGVTAYNDIKDGKWDTHWST